MMDVYQVIFDKHKDDGTITEIVEYVQAENLVSVAIAMDKREEGMDWTLKSVRYALTVVEIIGDHNAQRT